MRSLRWRMIAFLVALLGLVQLSEFVLTNNASYTLARAKLNDELQVGQKIFARVLLENQERETQAAAVLAADFAFREAIATGDRATVESALENHGARIGAKALLYVDLNGQVVADTLRPDAARRAFEYAPLIEQARNGGSASAIGALHQLVFQMIAVPVRTPITIGWIVVCFPIDAALANDLRDLTGLDVSFVRATGQHWTALASTLGSTDGRTLPQLLPHYGQALQLQQLQMPDGLHQVRVVALGGSDGDRTVAVLQRSFAEALARSDALRRTLVILAAVSLLLSLAGSVLMALSVTRPIEQLTAVVRRIREGDYAYNVHVRRDDEIGVLAHGLEHMRSGIAEREQRILKLAYEDSLTALPNRARFADVLQGAIADARERHKTFAILMMDLDRFKYVNDSLGHGVGDHVLRAVGLRLSTLTGLHSCVARLGGDEFAILSMHADVDQALHLAQQIIRAMEMPIDYQGQPLDVGTSIGIALYPAHGGDSDTLMRNADIAMYVAKRAKNGYAVYEPEYDSSQKEHLSLLGELRRAVERNELCLYYQPKLTLSSSTVNAAEALLRWVHPRHGLIPPAQFVPFAEHTGYIKVLTHWVLEQAIRQCGAWRRDGLAIQISVNISARDLMNRDLPDAVGTLLRAHEVPASQLCLEITESGFMEDPSHALLVLERLARLGVALSIDDYGTGYSSLSYIMRLPVNELKIDRSFVSRMGENAELATIVRSTIELGHSLGLRVVAEGVEDNVGLGLLRTLGCDSAQGYFMSPPLPPEAFRHWLDGSQPDAQPVNATGTATTADGSDTLRSA